MDLLRAFRSCYSMVMRLYLFGAAVVAFGLAACEHDDIGKACPELLGSGGSASGGGTGTAQTAEVVATDPSFPCEELICVASDGRDGYCSKKCASDVSCPAGFECRVIQPIGPFSSDEFCAWRKCASPADCGGSKGDFCCEVVPGSSPVQGQELKLCTFSKSGKCS